jgi:hypothetical protein
MTRQERGPRDERGGGLSSLRAPNISIMYIARCITQHLTTATQHDRTCPTMQNIRRRNYDASFYYIYRLLHSCGSSTMYIKLIIIYAVTSGATCQRVLTSAVRFSVACAAKHATTACQTSDNPLERRWIDPPGCNHASASGCKLVFLSPYD